MNKLSVASVQQALLEADEARRTEYETMKRNGQRLRTVGSLSDPSTKITSIKQVTMPKDQKRESGTHAPFMLQANMAGDYVDKMKRGNIYSEDSGSSGIKTPSVAKMKPNQRTEQEKVTPDMQKGSRKSESGNSQLWPAAERADHYVDAMPRGEVFSKDDKDGGNRLAGGVTAPEAKNLHGTTRPKSSKKSADMTRHPSKDQPSPGKPTGSLPTPKDAPGKRGWGRVKSGILVRVNESIKAKFDIVSETVLNRIIENYQRFGYRVVVEHSNEQPRWKSDQPFLRLLYETVAAKENQSPALYRKLGEASLNRFYHLCQNDYNNLYENRGEFLKTVKFAFGKIAENAVVSYREGLNLFINKARVVTENGGISDVEILAEATDSQMALRLVRNKLLETFGLGADIKFIFVDGAKYRMDQIQEWIPRVQV